MHPAPSPGLQAENERHIAEFIDGRSLTMLAAWGELIEARPYLSQMLDGIVSVTAASGCSWVSIGDFLKSGHPRHPSRAGYSLPMQSFDEGSYLRMVSARVQARAKRSALAGRSPDERSVEAGR